MRNKLGVYTEERPKSKEKEKEKKECVKALMAYN